MPKEKTYLKKLEDHCQKMIEDRDSAVQELVSYKKEVCFAKKKVVDKYRQIINEISTRVKNSNKISALYDKEKKTATISTELYAAHVDDLKSLVSQIRAMSDQLITEIDAECAQLEQRINNSTLKGLDL